MSKPAAMIKITLRFFMRDFLREPLCFDDSQPYQVLIHFIDTYPDVLLYSAPHQPDRIQLTSGGLMKMTNRERLEQAGILKRGAPLSAAQEKAIESLSENEVDCILSITKKMDKLPDPDRAPIMTHFNKSD